MAYLINILRSLLFIQSLRYYYLTEIHSLSALTGSLGIYKQVSIAVSRNIILIIHRLSLAHTHTSMEYFPARNTVPLAEPEIPPHFAARSAGNGGPNHASSSQRSTAEETTLGKDNNGQDHSGQFDGMNAALWHEVSNSPTRPQQDPQQANKTQSPPPRTEITYPTLPPSPPSIPASEQTYLHHHL